MELGKEVEHKACEEQLRVLECLILSKEGSGETLLFYNYLKGDCGKVSSPNQLVTGQGKMASSCTAGELGLIYRRISSPNEWLSIGTGSLGKWWSLHPWKCSKNEYMWHFVIQFTVIWWC